jgi:pteridine reductase
MKKSLLDKTALVTGGSRRIGREICLALAQEGVNVVIHYHKSDFEAKGLCDSIRKMGVNSWTLAADFNNAKSAETLVQKTLKLAGNLDIVINNASVYTESTLKSVDLRDLSLNMQVNAWTPLIISREFKRLVGKGSIVNLLDSRISGYDPTHAGYILSKRALAAFTGMMALEFAPRIAVNAVAPGLVLPPPGMDAGQLKKLAAGLPLNRSGEPGDVAHAVVFLLQSSFITGQVIYVDGGRNIRELMK